MRLKLLFVILFSLTLSGASAQELYANVEVNSQQVQISDRRIFTTLRNAMFEFLNNKIWSGYDYKQEEKIECSFLLTITEKYGDEYKGTLTIASQRPVFNSTYNSVLLNTVDKDVEFRYIEFEPLDFYENSFTNNLTSILAYYAYMIIGLDFDSYTLNGGDQFYQAAQNVVNAAQNSSYKGWKSFEDQRNRYWLVENLTNPAYDPINRFFYEYHLKGLDMMYENTERGRANVLIGLKSLKKAHEERANLLIFQIISDAKRDEIINIFSEGTTTEKNEVLNIMREIDPAHYSDYQKIMQ